MTDETDVPALTRALQLQVSALSTRLLKELDEKLVLTRRAQEAEARVAELEGRLAELEERLPDEDDFVVTITEHG